MKKGVRFFLRTTNLILGGLMSVLGLSLSSCDSLVPRVEYGTPYAEFEVSGKVINEEGKPILGIKVDVEQSRYGVNPVLTESDGAFVQKGTVFPHSEYRLIVADIDGEENGAFKNDTIKFIVKDSDYVTKGKNWDHGRFVKKFGEITLKSK